MMQRLALPKKIKSGISWMDIIILGKKIIVSQLNLMSILMLLRTFFLNKYFINSLRETGGFKIDLEIGISILQCFLKKIDCDVECFDSKMKITNDVYSLSCQ